MTAGRRILNLISGLPRPRRRFCVWPPWRCRRPGPLVVAGDDRRLTIQAAQALVLTAAVRVFFSTAWVNTHISQYLLHMLITICLLHVMARVLW